MNRQQHREAMEKCFIYIEKNFNETNFQVKLNKCFSDFVRHFVVCWNIVGMEKKV